MEICFESSLLLTKRIYENDEKERYALLERALTAGVVNNLMFIQVTDTQACFTLLNGALQLVENLGVVAVKYLDVTLHFV